MKKVFTTLAILFLGFAVQAQTNMGINNANPDASAALDVTSTTQGMLTPRMTLAQRNMINMVGGVSTPATGLLIYQTDNTPGFYFYNGTAWAAVGGATASGPITVLAVSKNAAQTTSVATNTTAPDVILFQNITTSVTSSIASWSTSTNIFTVGASGAGWYLIDVQLTSNLTFSVPMVELNAAGAVNANNLYGTGQGSSQTLQSPYRFRGALQRLVFLAAGTTFQVRAASGSTVAGVDLNGDASCYLKVVKMN